MDTGNQTKSQTKRTERIKSIFDSDDSDEDNEKCFSNLHSKDDDNDDDLRKQIDEVCFNLSTDEEKIGLGVTPIKPTVDLNIKKLGDKYIDVSYNLSKYDDTILKVAESTGIENIEKLEEDKSEEININLATCCTNTQVKDKMEMLDNLNEDNENEHQTINTNSNLVFEGIFINEDAMFTTKKNKKAEGEACGEENNEMDMSNTKIVAQQNISTKENEIIIEKNDIDTRENELTIEEKRSAEESDANDENKINTEENEINTDENILNIEENEQSSEKNKLTDYTKLNIEKIEMQRNEMNVKEHELNEEQNRFEMSRNKNDVNVQNIEMSAPENTINFEDNKESMEVNEESKEFNFFTEIESKKKITHRDVEMRENENDKVGELFRSGEEMLVSENVSLSQYNETKDIKVDKKEDLEEVDKMVVPMLEQSDAISYSTVESVKEVLGSSDARTLAFSFETEQYSQIDEPINIKNLKANRSLSVQFDERIEDAKVEEEKVKLNDNDLMLNKLKETQYPSVQILFKNKKRDNVEVPYENIKSGNSPSEQVCNTNSDIKLLTDDLEDEKMETDYVEEETHSDSYVTQGKLSEHKVREECEAPFKNKDSELANLSDVWNTVNIFQGPKLVSLSEAELKIPSKSETTPEFDDSENDSGTDINDKGNSSLQSFRNGVEVKGIQIEDLTHTTQSAKENTNSPWEAMKNGSLFEEVQVLHEQSPEYQLIEGVKRKKVRVEDVFTDSEGEEGSKHLHKIKKGPSDLIHQELVDGVKKAKKKRERATSINLPAIMLAFEKGWIREVVYRSSAGVANKRADIYYYSPSKRKLRSRLELEEYLLKNNVTDLNLQNFSFFKEPLGVEEKYEKIRHASNLVKLGHSPPRTGVCFTVAKSPLPKKRDRKPTTKAKDLPPTKKAKTKDDVVKKVMIKDALQKSPSTAFAKKKGPLLASKPLYQIPCSDSSVYATHLYPANPPLTQARIITPVIHGETNEKGFHCTPSCEGGGGSVPNLQCVKCVCLFHSECCQMPPQTVSIILSAIAKFLCPNCYKEEKLKKSWVDECCSAPCFEPLAFDPSSSESEDEGIMVSDFEHPSFVRIRARPHTPPLLHLPSLTIPHNKHEHDHNIADHGTSPQFTSLKSSSHLNVPVILPTHNALFPQQRHQMSSLIPNLPLAVPFPTTSSPGPSSFLLYQPIAPKTRQLATHVYNMPVGTSFCKGPPQEALPPTALIAQQLAMPSPTLKKTTNEEKMQSGLSQAISGVRGDWNFLGDMSRAYHVLRRIFGFLSVSDLLVASRVCVLWRDLALNPHYWKCVQLRNLCINDWDKMVEFLDRRGTEELDLRKMVIHADLLKQNKTFVLNDIIDTEEEETTKESEEETLKDKANENEEVEAKIDDDNDKALKEKGEEEKEIEEGRENEHKKIEKEKPVIDLFLPQNEREEENDKEKLSSPLTDQKRSENENKKEEEEVIVREELMKLQEAEEKQQQGKDEEKRREREKREKMNYIVSSVLSEHDYFGRHMRTASTSSGTESNTSEDGSSSSSSDSEEDEDETREGGRTEMIEGSCLDVTEEDIERTFQNLEDNMSMELPLPVGEETLKPLLLELPIGGGQVGVVEEKEERENSSITPPLPLSRSERKDIREGNTEEEKEEGRKEEKRKAKKDNEEEKELTNEEIVATEWRIISTSLGKMKSLGKIIVGACDPSIAETLLSHCHQLVSFNFINLGCSSVEDLISFDPSFLMHTRHLEELRLTSQQNFTFKSNFNFIKLPLLKVLVLKGLKTTDIGWPYLGIHLTQLHLSSISTFSHHNWSNVSTMTDLVELELDGGGSDHDAELCSTLVKLPRLKRLSLFDWNIGSRLPHILKRLHNINILYIIPAVESQSMRGIFAGRLMVVVECSKHLEEFTWGIQPQSVMVDETAAGDKVFILNMKGGKETGTIEGEEVRGVSIDSLTGFIRCRIPHTKITVTKVSSNCWSWSSTEGTS